MLNQVLKLKYIPYFISFPKQTIIKIYVFLIRKRKFLQIDRQEILKLSCSVLVFQNSVNGILFSKHFFVFIIFYGICVKLNRSKNNSFIKESLCLPTTQCYIFCGCFSFFLSDKNLARESVITGFILVQFRPIFGFQLGPKNLNNYNFFFLHIQVLVQRVKDSLSTLPFTPYPLNLTPCTQYLIPYTLPPFKFILFIIAARNYNYFPLKKNGFLQVEKNHKSFN